MDDRIRAALASHGADLKSVKPLHGGACQENFRVELEHEGQPLTLALRSDATSSLPGSISRNVEFEVISAATAAGVKTPKARWLQKSLLRDGSDAYFLEWVRGEAIGRRVVRNPELEAARAKLPGELAETLAKIHSVTPKNATIALTPRRMRSTICAASSVACLAPTLPSSSRCSGSAAGCLTRKRWCSRTVTFAPATSWSRPRA
jgi:aminoglycoside phosphotransferase (APT) family kinase protein